MKKRIIVIDDEPLIGSLMKAIIEDDEGLEITRITGEKNEFLNLVDQGHFDAGIVDISVGGREGGLELLEAMKNKEMDLPITIMSAHDEVHYALKCLQAGARGYINKRYICTDVVRCLRQVFDGYLYVSGDKGDQILKEYRKLNTPVSV